MKEELVTVAVTTYNCENFVEETLESIVAQNYPNIELLISDDFSTDGTLNKVYKWSKQEKIKGKFSRIHVLTVGQNTGISANCNRCIREAKSDWIKFIAGDDILLPNCISANMDFVNKNRKAQVIFSSVQVFERTFEEENFKEVTPAKYPNNLMDPSFDALDQWKILLENDRIHYTPSYFFNRKALARVGNYDESNRLVEDYPMWLKLTKAGIKLHFCDATTVGYRVYKFLDEKDKVENIFNASVVVNFETRKRFAHPNLNWFRVKQESWNYYISKLFMKFDINKKKSFYPKLYYVLTVIVNPFFYLDAIYRRLIKTPIRRSKVKMLT